MTLRMTVLPLAALLLFAWIAPPQFMMTTRVENNVTTSWNFGCPSYGGNSAMVVSIDRLDLSDAQIDQLSALIDAYEYEHGIFIRSTTTRRGDRVIDDKINSVTTGPMDDNAKGICDIVRAAYKG